MRIAPDAFRAIAEASADHIMILELDGSIAYINRTAPDLTVAEVIGTSLYAYLTPDDAQSLRDCCERVIRTGKPSTCQVGYQEKSGAVWSFKSRVTPISERGKITALAVCATNVTERKQAEEALRESEELHRSLLEATPDALVIVDKEGIIETMNAQVEALFGYKRDELVGKSVEMLVPERIRHLHGEQRQAYATEPYTRPMGAGADLHGVRRDGSEFPVDISLSSLETGQGFRVMAGVRDVTERKEAEQALRESEERFRQTLDGLLEGCQIISFGWRYLYVNDAAAEHGRRAKEELLGHTMMEIYPGINGTELFAHLGRCMQERVPHRMLNEFAYPHGASGWFELSMQPVPEGVLVLSWDVTEQKQAEEALHLFREELESKVEHGLRHDESYGLTFREMTVLHLVAEGQADKEIAAVLGIRPLTVSKHVSNILGKMDAHSRTEAGTRAVREGLLG